MREREKGGHEGLLFTTQCVACRHVRTDSSPPRRLSNAPFRVCGVALVEALGEAFCIRPKLLRCIPILCGRRDKRDNGLLGTKIAKSDAITNRICNNPPPSTTHDTLPPPPPSSLDIHEYALLWSYHTVCGFSVPDS